MIRYDIVRSVNNVKFLAVAIHRDGAVQYQGLSTKAEDWAEWASQNLQALNSKSIGADLEVMQTSYASSEEQLSQAIQRLKQEGIPMRNKGNVASTTKTGAWSTTPSFREFQLGAFAPDSREMVIDFKALAFVADSLTSSRALVGRLKGPRANIERQAGSLSTKAARPKLGARIGGGLRSPNPGMAFVDVTGQIDADADGIVFERTPMQRPIIPRLDVSGNPLQVPRSSAVRAQEQSRLAARRSISDRRTGMRSFSEPDADLAAELDEIADRQRDLAREDAVAAKPRKTVAQLRRELEDRKARRATGMTSESRVPEDKIQIGLTFGEMTELEEAVDAMRNENALGDDTALLDPLSQNIFDALSGGDVLLVDRDVAESVLGALEKRSSQQYDKRASQISSVLASGLDSDTREWTSPALEESGTLLNLPVRGEGDSARRRPGAVRRAIASRAAQASARQQARRRSQDRRGMRSGSSEQWNQDRAFDLRQDEMGDELDLRARGEAARAEESAAEMYDMEREIAMESFSGSSDYNDAFAQWMADEKPGRSPSAITDELRDEFESSDAYAGALDTYMLDNADDLAQAVAGSRRGGMRSRTSASERSGDRLVVDSMGRRDFRAVKSRVDELLERQTELRDLMDRESDEDAWGAMDDELVSVGQELDGISQALSGYLREDRGRQLDAMATDIAIEKVRGRIRQLESGRYEDKPAGQKMKAELERALSELTSRRRDLDDLYSDGNGAERLYEEAGLDEVEDELSIDKSPRVWSRYNYDWDRVDMDVDRETAGAFADELLDEYVGDIPSPEDVSRVYDFRKIQLDTGNSRAIEKLTWDGEESELIVTFAGGRTYTYKDVPDDVAGEIESSPENLGRLINDIKKNYEVTPGGEHAPDSTLTENAAQRARYGMRSRTDDNSWLSRVGTGQTSRIDVGNSRAVQALTWDDRNRQLIVTYGGRGSISGRTYTYGGVDPDLIREIETSPESLGKLINDVKRTSDYVTPGGEHTRFTPVNAVRQRSGMRSRTRQYDAAELMADEYPDAQSFDALPADARETLADQMHEILLDFDNDYYYDFLNNNKEIPDYIDDLTREVFDDVVGNRAGGMRSRAGGMRSYTPTRTDTEFSKYSDYGYNYAENFRESDYYEQAFMEWASEEGIENPNIEDESQWRAFEDSDFGVSTAEDWINEEAQRAYESRVEGFWGGDIPSPRWDRNTESMQYGMRSRAGGMRSYQDIAQAMFRDSDDFDTAMDDYIDSPEGIDDGEGDLPTARDFLNSRTYQEYLAKFIEDNSDDIDSVYYMSRDGKPLAGDELDRAIEIREASGMRSASDKPAQSLVQRTLERADVAFGGYARWDDDTYSNFIAAGEVLDGVIPGGPEYTEWFESARDGINSGELLTDLSDNDKKLVAGIFDRAARLSRDGGSRRGMRSTSVPADLGSPSKDVLDRLRKNKDEVGELSLANMDLRGLPLSDGPIVFDSDMRGSFFGDATIKNARLENNNLNSAILDDVYISESDLRANDFSDASMQNAWITGTNFTGSLFDRANLSGSTIKGINLSSTSFIGADLSDSTWETRHNIGPGFDKTSFLNLRGASFESANLSGANLRSIDLRGADFSGATFDGANLDGAKVNVDMPGASFRQASLYTADLGDANAAGCDFSGADLAQADLRGTILTSTKLTGTSLRGADLSGADLTDADLSGADLTDADLRGANLSGANLNGAILDGAQLDQGWEQVVGMRSRSQGPDATPLSREQLDSLSDREMLNALLIDRFSGLTLEQAARKYSLPSREDARRLEAREMRRRRNSGEPVLPGEVTEQVLMRDLSRAGLSNEDMDYLFYLGVSGIPDPEKRDIAQGVIDRFNNEYNAAVFSPPSDDESIRPEMRSRSVGSARSRSSLAVEDRAKQQRSLRATRGLDPGISQTSDADGRIWAGLTDDDKSTVTSRARQREKDLLTYFKRRYPNYWAEVMDRSQSDKWKKKEGWIDEETPITQMIFELDSRVRKSQNDPNLSPTMKAELLRNMDDLRALFNMRNNDSYEMLEHLHPSSRSYLFDDAKRNDGKTTAATASGVKRSPSTFFGKVNRAEMVQPEAATSTPDGGSDTAPKKGKAPVGERVAAWAEKMRDSVLYESERRRRLRQMREARKNGVNAGAFSPDERQPLKPLERKARLAKRAIILKKGAKRDVPDLANDATKNRVNGRLAIRGEDGTITISDGLATALGAAFDADEKHKRLAKSKKKAPEGGWRNEDLAFLWDGAGFNGTPMPINRDQYDALVRAGWTPLVRGHGAERYAEDYIDDPVRFIPGQGGEAAGPGEYFALMPQGKNWYGFVRTDEASATIALLPPDARRVSQADLRNVQKEHRKLAQSIRAFDSGLPDGEREKMNGADYVEQLNNYLRGQLGDGMAAAMGSDMGQIIAQLLNQLSTASPSKKRDILDSLKYLNSIAYKTSPNYYAPILGFDAISVDERELVMNRTAVVVLGETKDYDGVVEVSDSVREARRR